MRKFTKLFTTKAQSIDETRKSIRFKISDNQPDRMDEIVDQESWDFKNYLKNPVVLWGHNPDEPENVLGQTLDLKTEDGATYAEMQFDDDINPKAGLVWKQILKGTLRTVSVGFIAHEIEGNVLKNNELLEISVVPIPANPRAIALSYKAGEMSKKDASWLMESMKRELENLEEQLRNAPDAKETNQMDEASKKQIAALASTVANMEKKIDAMNEKVDAHSKGAVADIASIEDRWELEDDKWELMSPVSKLYWALQDAWYYPATPVDAFDALVREFISLVSDVLGGSTEKLLPTDERLAKALESLSSDDVKARTQKALKPETKDAQTGTDDAKDDEGNQDDDLAKGGDNDQSGAENEIDLDAELTPELEAQIEAELAESAA